MRLVHAHPERPFGLAELRPIVDAVERPVVIESDGADDPAILAGQPDEFGQVQLPRCDRWFHRPDPASEPGRIECVAAGVDLVRIEFLG